MVLIIPFIGTTLGAACVFFMKKELSMNIQKALTGFAAGVMVAASIWSLIIPSLEQASTFIPTLIGFWLGILFLLLLDHLIPHMHLDHSQEGPRSHLSQTIKLVLARNGSRYCLCLLLIRKSYNYGHGCTRIITRYRNTEFS